MMLNVTTGIEEVQLRGPSSRTRSAGDTWRMAAREAR